MLKTLKWIAFSVVGLVAVLTVAVVVMERRKFDAPYPDLHASKDPETIARGEYLVKSVALCGGCHGDPGKAEEQVAQSEKPFSGGQEWHLPFGTLRAPNITTDVETGIGRLSDAEIARTLRYGVGSDGRSILPLMQFQQMSDDDLVAIISYLRTQAPVKHAVTIRELNPLGHVLQAFVLKPKGPTEEPKAKRPPEPTKEYGEYLARGLSDCNGCHTKRSTKDGSFIAPEFSGGFELVSHEKPDMKFITPNLTPDPKTGRIYDWSEEAFIARFRMGPLVEGTPMPWKAFSTMSENDLQAIYRYLRSLQPVENETGAPVQVADAK